MATEVHNLLQARILKVQFVKFTVFCYWAKNDWLWIAKRCQIFT